MIVIMITTIIILVVTSEFDNNLQQSCDLKMKIQRYPIIIKTEKLQN